MKEETKTEIKKDSLNFAENISKDTVDYVFSLIETIVKDSENPIDDAIVLPALQFAKPKVYELIDKIDGEQG